MSQRKTRRDRRAQQLAKRLNTQPVDTVRTPAPIPSTLQINGKHTDHLEPKKDGSTWHVLSAKTIVKQLFIASLGVAATLFCQSLDSPPKISTHTHVKNQVDVYTSRPTTGLASHPKSINAEHFLAAYGSTLTIGGAYTLRPVLVAGVPTLHIEIDGEDEARSVTVPMGRNKSKAIHITARGKSFIIIAEKSDEHFIHLQTYGDPYGR